MSELQVLQSAQTNTPNEIVKYCMTLMNMNLFFAASCILKLLYPSLNEDDRPKIASLLAQCGLALGSEELMKYAKTSTLQLSMRNVIGFVLETELHRHMLAKCERDCIELPFLHATEDLCLAICAGGPKLMLQLWTNLHSLISTGFNNTDVVIVHADEISETEENKFKLEFSKYINLKFLNVMHCTQFTELMPQAVALLRGYQIKLCALCILPYKRILLCDADILWITNPQDTLTEIHKSASDMFVFSDIWHFQHKRHEKSSTTSFLYRLHGIPFDIQEFESGFVYMNRESNPSVVKMLLHLCINYKYYFNFTFGDKDLYYLAASKFKATILRADQKPQMLGNIVNGEFTSQSMVQFYGDKASHIHMTLHPISDENAAIPTHLCEDCNDIKFVRRNISGQDMGTVACDMAHATLLPASNVYSNTYVRGFVFSKWFSPLSLS